MAADFAEPLLPEVKLQNELDEDPSFQRLSSAASRPIRPFSVNCRFHETNGRQTWKGIKNCHFVEVFRDLASPTVGTTVR